MIMLTVERALMKDAEEITRIKTSAYNKEINTYLGRDGGPPGYNQVESERYIISNFIAYKILLENHIIGALFLKPLSDHTMRFEDFVIDPNNQGNGYGYQIMKMIEEMHPDIREWRLSTPVFSVSNQHLYRKFGYVEVSRNDDEIEYVKIIKTIII